MMCAPIARELHVGLYGNDEELVHILRVEYNPVVGLYDVDYVWIKGYAGHDRDEILHSHLKPNSPWRLPEVPFTIEEWP